MLHSVLNCAMSFPHSGSYSLALIRSRVQARSSFSVVFRIANRSAARMPGHQIPWQTTDSTRHLHYQTCTAPLCSSLPAYCSTTSRSCLLL